MKEVKQERETYIDIAKGLGILLVLLGHIEYMALWKVKFIYSFHMPFFFFVSGLLWHAGGKKTPGTIIKTRLKSIMLPYAIWSVVLILFHLLIYYVTGRWNFPGTLKEAVTDTLCLYGYSVLWFLPALFLAETVYLLCSLLSGRICKKSEAGKNGLALFFSAAVALTFYHATSAEACHFVIMLSRMLLCSVFIGAGVLLKDAVAFFKEKAVPAFLLGIASFVLLFFTSQLNAHIDMHTGGYGNLILFYLNALLGSLGLLLVSAGLSVLSKWETAPFVFFGRNSLIYMIAHLDLQVVYVTEWLIIRFTHYEELTLAPWYFVGAIFLGTVFGTTVLAVIWLWLKKKWKCISGKAEG